MTDKQPEIVEATGPDFDAQGNVVFDFRDCAEFTALRDTVDILHNDFHETHVVGKNPPRNRNATEGFILDTPENRQLFERVQALIEVARNLLLDVNLPIEKIIREDDEEGK